MKQLAVITTFIIILIAVTAVSAQDYPIYPHEPIYIYIAPLPGHLNFNLGDIASTDSSHARTASAATAKSNNHPLYSSWNG